MVKYSVLTAVCMQCICAILMSAKLNYCVSLVSHVRLCILKAALRDKVSMTDFWMQVMLSPWSWQKVILSIVVGIARAMGLWWKQTLKNHVSIYCITCTACICRAINTKCGGAPWILVSCFNGRQGITQLQPLPLLTRVLLEMAIEGLTASSSLWQWFTVYCTNCVQGAEDVNRKVILKFSAISSKLGKAGITISTYLRASQMDWSWWNNKFIYWYIQ